MTYSEVIKVVEFEPIDMGAQAPLLFRAEVHRKARSYFVRLYRLETFRLRPTFPQKRGRRLASDADEEVWVLDGTALAEEVVGSSVERVLKNLVSKMRDVFGLEQKSTGRRGPKLASTRTR